MNLGAFEPEELEAFITGLRRRPDGTPSLMLSCALQSGYAARFSAFFNPFEYEEEARQLAGSLPPDKTLLALICPENQYAARFYAFPDHETRAILLPDWKRMSSLEQTHPGFAGLDDPRLEREYQVTSGNKDLYEKSLVLAAATALYRALGSRKNGLYLMELSWDRAYRIDAGGPALARTPGAAYSRGADRP